MDPDVVVATARAALGMLAGKGTEGHQGPTGNTNGPSVGTDIRMKHHLGGMVIEYPNWLQISGEQDAE